MTQTTKFEIKSTRFLLTFSQIPIDKVKDFLVIKDTIIAKESIKNGIIAKEQHKDGGTHFHIYLEYANRKRIYKPDYFDFIFDHHGKYEAVRSSKKTINYIIKDMNYFLIGDILSFKDSTLIKEFIKSKAKEGYAAHDLFRIKNSKAVDDFIFDSGQKVNRYNKYYQNFNHDLEMEKRSWLNKFDLEAFDQYVFDPKIFPNVNTLRSVLAAVNSNSEPRSRAYKAKMLHLWSTETDTGKTSIIHFLREHCPCYIWPDDNWFDTYDNKMYQWILWDEFTPKGWDGNFLNRFLSGESMRLPVKGSHTFKKDNPLIIMTSNRSIREHCANKWFNSPSNKSLYTKTFQTRLQEIEIKKPLFTCYESFINLLNAIAVFNKPVSKFSK